ncbi:MAG: LPS sulfotransferase NodH [Ilumatobacter sp.]|jgi:LPS sulfotransferase NodH
MVMRATARLVATRVSRLARWAADPRAVLSRLRRTDQTPGESEVDWPETAAEQTVVIASEVRTGSTMLSDLLASTEHCGVPTEYCSPYGFSSWEGTHGFPKRLRQEVLIGWWRRVRLRRFWDRSWHYEHAEIERYLDDVIRRRTTPNGVFAVNIHWHQWIEMERLGFDDSWFPGEVTWVHLWREDVVAQAVSALRALQTDTWRSDVSSSGRREQPRYDEPELERLVRKAVDGRAGWDRYFAERGIEPYRVSYERLSADREQVIAELLDTAGIELPEPLPGLIASRLQRQAGGLNADWIARYRERHPEFNA